MGLSLAYFFTPPTDLEDLRSGGLEGGKVRRGPRN